MESYDIYLRKFKVAIGIVALTIALFVVFLMQIIPKIQEIATIQKDTRTKTSSLADLERRLEDLKKTQKEKNDTPVFLKQFFKPINGGSDTETVIADEFAEILQVIRDNKIKMRAIKYDYEDALQDDNFVKFAAGKYHVCRVTADMIGSYSALENLFRDLYKHEHFLEISKIEIVPYEKNKKILLANVQIKLYAQRDPNSPAPNIQPTAAPAAQEAAAATEENKKPDSGKENNSDEGFDF